MKAKNFLTSTLMIVMLIFSMAFIGCDLASASPMDNHNSIVSMDQFDPLCVNITAEQSVPAQFVIAEELFSPFIISGTENRAINLSGNNFKKHSLTRSCLSDFVTRKSESAFHRKLFSVKRLV